MSASAAQTQPPAPTKECDLVMKGGITSGIVYPPLVLKLHEQGYGFRNIGGTSAGAIAAAVTAAAECGRDREGGGFERLREISEQMRQEDFVRNLFQPTGGTGPLMETLFAMKNWDAVRPALMRKWYVRPLSAILGKRAVEVILFGQRLSQVLAEKNYGPYQSGKDTGENIALSATFYLLALPISFLFLLASVLIVDAWWPALKIAGIGLFFTFLIFAFVYRFGRIGGMIGGLAGGLQDLYSTLTTRVPKNDFGLCNGMRKRGPADEPSHEVLTEWLHGALQKLSGREAGSDPLTFGDLWKWPEPRAGEDVKKRRGRRIDLRMVTANLSQNQPYVLPFERDDLFIFKREDVERLFPKEVADYMTEKGKERRCQGLELPEGYYFLPQAKDLPVIFATRMSLSFPVLISMVPLYTISGGAFGDKKVRIEVVSKAPEREKWDKEAPEDEKWDELKRGADGRTPIVPPYLKTQWELQTDESIHLREEVSEHKWVESREIHQLTDTAQNLQDNWFSDGGICSNFPIHFFDAWLPTRPTFGVNLTSQMGNVSGQTAAASDMVVGAAVGGLGEQPQAKDAAAAERRERAVRSRSSIATVQGSTQGDAAPETAPVDDDKDVYLPRPDEVMRPEWIPITDLVKFLSSVFTTAQNYRDNMQAALPSYRERIVQVRLTDKEGGLNLDMPRAVLENVAAKGERAGEKLSSYFNKRSHQWVRFRVLMKQMESQLVDMNRIMNEDLFYKGIINREEKFDTTGLPYVPPDFEPVPHELEGWRHDIIEQLLAIGKVIGDFKSGDLFARDPQPMPEPVLRVTPRI